MLGGANPPAALFSVSPRARFGGEGLGGSPGLRRGAAPAVGVASHTERADARERLAGRLLVPVGHERPGGHALGGGAAWRRRVSRAPTSPPNPTSASVT